MSNQNVEYLPASQEQIVGNLVLQGDLSGLHPMQKVEYYKAICERIGLDPLTQPFKLIYFKRTGKEVLYCDRSGAQQLNKLHSVSHQIMAREAVHDCYVVTARASLPDGRQTESIGAVPIGGLKGDAFANAIMKAETKAKRRSTLDLLGLGMLDESEIETISNARTVPAPVAPVHVESQKPTITEKQKNLILNITKSDLFTDEEREKAKAFVEKASKGKASEFIDRLLSLKDERKQAEKDAEAEQVVDSEEMKPKSEPEFEPEGTPEELRQKAEAIRQAAAMADKTEYMHKDMDRAKRLEAIADRREAEVKAKDEEQAEES